MEWIKCSEQMPDSRVDVIGIHIEGYPIIVQFDGDVEFYCGEDSRGRGWWLRESMYEPLLSYTHWMPLPTPPTG
ncbi:DUF551 domain-containing protein [Rosenbergiella metrosideri]|uniref:DUF551 domain-containing protein n=1 Tax=Rosenbergiella metrosideri TaxID=2921185 RepID=UPI001F4FA21D|nr:DUF551 domain-containing protein [Rosenbergiella metrosideri]